MKTYGYDYVFALSIDTINAVLTANLENVDQTIEYSDVDHESGLTVLLNAQLAPWQILGGQNSLINVNLPIKQGSLELAGPITGIYDLGGVVPEMQISLGWVGTGDKQAAIGSGDNTQLTFDPDPDANQNNPGYVATLQIADPGNKLSPIAKQILSSLMTAALFDNQANVAYVFATVNPAPPGLASWLNPGEWQYFVAQAGDSGVLCFLCMLADGAAFPSEPAFDPSAPQPSANSVVLISQQAFFANVVLPAVRSTFPGGTFQADTTDGQTSITSSAGFDVDTVAVTSYSLTSSPAGDGVATSSAGGGPLTFLFGVDLPDASYSWTLTTVNPLHYDGTSLSFATDASPVTQQDTTIHWYDWVLLVALGITGPVALASEIQDMVDKFGDQAQKVGMATINTDIQAATGGAAMNLSQVIDWTKGGQVLTLTTAGMSEAVFVAGNLTVPASRSAISALSTA